MSSVPTTAAADAVEPANGGAEEFAFSSDIGQLMGLIINTFYSDKEVFLRELISNASDAVYKIRLASLSGDSGEVLGAECDLRIDIVPDAEAKTLTIHDTGVGMTRDHLVNNLGTIARSGTKQFMEAATTDSSNGGDANSLIGQFGVGFYSSFLVADHVDVYSKHNDDAHTWKWSSSASGSFTVERADDAKHQLVRGTRIVLHLKADQLGMLQEKRIRDLVQKHSQYISTPIRLLTTRTEKHPVAAAAVPVPSPTSEEDEDDDAMVQDVTDEKEQPQKEEDETIQEFERLNMQAPIWTRSPKDVTKAEYEAFYQSETQSYQPPLAYKHVSVEGQFQFKALLFCPVRSSFQQADFSSAREKNVKVFARRVFVTADCTEKLLPDWLGFVSGVVDSEDLPLNVSRETLQASKALPVMRKQLVKKAIDMFTDMANAATYAAIVKDDDDDDDDEAATDEAATAAAAAAEAKQQQIESWRRFYGTYSKFLKIGVYEDDTNRDKLVELLRFTSSNAGENAATSLAEYVKRMKDGQKSIFCVAGESESIVGSSPFVEGLVARGLEVLYMTETMDEYVMQKVKKYQGFPLVDVSKRGADLGWSDAEQQEQAVEQAEWADVCALVKQALGGRVEKVALSYRLGKSPCVLVTNQEGWSANMERIMKTQAATGDADMMASYMRGKKTLELNPKHSLCLKIREWVAPATTSPEHRKSARFMADTLFQTALLTSGFSPSNPAEYGARIFSLLDDGCRGFVFNEELGDDWADPPPAAAPDVEGCDDGGSGGEMDIVMGGGNGNAVGK